MPFLARLGAATVGSPDPSGSWPYQGYGAPERGRRQCTAGIAHVWMGTSRTDPPDVSTAEQTGDETHPGVEPGVGGFAGRLTTVVTWAR